MDEAKGVAAVEVAVAVVSSEEDLEKVLEPVKLEVFLLISLVSQNLMPQRQALTMMNAPRNGNAVGRKLGGEGGEEVDLILLLRTIVSHLTIIPDKRNRHYLKKQTSCRWKRNWESRNSERILQIIEKNRRMRRIKTRTL